MSPLADLLRYPDGVSGEEGEDWFLRVHAPEVASQPGLVRFFSHKVLQNIGSVPGRWRPDTMAPESTVKTRWDRAMELWYETFEDWRRAVVGRTLAYTRPAWATQDAYPFLRPYEELASTFILERPNDDFLRDLRGYVP